MLVANECPSVAKLDVSWQQRFLDMLPSIRRHAQIRFRGFRAEAREELIEETVAGALVSYRRLVERDKEHLARATPLSRFAVAQVRAGRRVGVKLNCKDISSEYCQRRNGFILQSLNASEGETSGWREIIVESRHSGPADTAAARIDFGAWLDSLPSRHRRLAERLASGESTSSVAQVFGISSSRVSQLRGELCRAWYTFQDEPDGAAK